MSETHTGLPLFDLSASLAARDKGMQQAADNNASLLKFARKLAVEIAEKKGTVTMDDIAFALHSRGISIFALGNAAGSVFRGKQWQFTGQLVKSVREHSHGNLLRCWRLVK